MTSRKTSSAVAFALGAILTVVSSAASAGPPGNILAQRPAAPAPNRPSEGQAANCDCRRMMGDAAMRDQCMSMMSDHRGETSEPRQPG